MPRKTLLLIVGLFLFTVVLLSIALSPSNKMKNTTPGGTTTPKPTVSMAHTTVSLEPSVVTLQPFGTGSVDIMVDSSDNKITGVQMELSYDPKVVQITDVTSKGSAVIDNPLVLLKKIDATKGTLSYAVVVPLNGRGKTGTGSVATIQLKAVGAVGTQTNLVILPKTIVTAEGVESSVLKRGLGAMVKVGSTNAGTNATPSAK